VRVTDLNTEAAWAVEMRAAQEDIMRTYLYHSQYTNIYVGPEDVAKLTPEKILLMRTVFARSSCLIAGVRISSRR